MQRSITDWLSRNAVTLIGQVGIIIAAFAVMRTELTAHAEAIRDLRETDIKISEVNLKTVETLSAVTATLDALSRQVDRQRDDITDLRRMYISGGHGG